MKQLLRKILTKIKRPNKKGLIFVFAVAGVLLAMGALVYFKDIEIGSNKKAVVNCSDLSNSTNELLKQRDYEKAYKELQARSGLCGASKEAVSAKSGTEQQKLETFNYDSNLAKAAYLAGDKENAKEAANKAIILSSGMSGVEQSKISEYSKSMYELDRISNGFYNPDAGL